MNTHIPDELKRKYPQMEFRGKPKIVEDRKVISAVNHATDQHFYYSFDEDFFWFKDSGIPNWRIN